MYVIPLLGYVKFHHGIILGLRHSPHGDQIETLAKGGHIHENLIFPELLEQGDETTAARKELLLRQGDEIRERIAGLERALARLEYKIEHYNEVMTATERTLRAGE